MQKNKIALVWYTNNLRITDNAIFYNAFKNYKNVIGVYCFSPKKIKQTHFGFLKIAKIRAQFLLTFSYRLSDMIKIIITETSGYKLLCIK